ncbi:MAG: HNH endonuclease [Endomicrobium sp.]|jgi:5-methylcytosine-specific restriction endonuclease McrA|nr:HNH endonuclease [Endomicrobium sp.]
MKQKLKPIPSIKKKLDSLWSEKVRARDCKCVMCGKSGKGLQAHHYIKAKARSLKYRWDPRNGITLCYGCHMYTVHMTASYEAVSRLVDYAVKNELLTNAELAEIVNDKEERDLRTDRGFMEAARLNLEEYNG